jgi:RHS repeat-associated protein
VTKTTGTTLRHYYYSNQWQILEERLNTATTADRQFVWGLMALDNLILRDRGSERFYSLQDVFSCTAIVDTTGTIQERYGYNAFGLSRVMDVDFNVISASSHDWETRYDNYRYDSESNFYQVRNRYLHPTLGRWLTRDPIGYSGGINLYAYVNNTPLSHIDRLGLAETVLGFIVDCAVDFIQAWALKKFTKWLSTQFICDDVRDYNNSGHSLADWCGGVTFDEPNIALNPNGPSYGQALVDCIWGRISSKPAEYLSKGNENEKKLIKFLIDHDGPNFDSDSAQSKYRIFAQCCKGGGSYMMVTLSFVTTITINGESMDFPFETPVKSEPCASKTGANDICGNC